MGWHIDRTINLGVVLTICIQAAYFIWQLSAVNSHLIQIDVTDSRQDSRLLAVEQSTQAQAIAAAATSAQITAIRDTLDQIRNDQRETNALLRKVMETDK